MADPDLFDPAAFGPLPALFDPRLYPDDLPIPPDLDLDDVLNLDLDLDLDLDIDLDFPIDDLIQSPHNEARLFSSDASPPPSDPDQNSGVSAANSPVASSNRTSDLCSNTGPPSPESGHSGSYSPDSAHRSSSPSSDVSDPEVKLEEERDPAGLKRKKGSEDGIPNPNPNPNSNIRASKIRRPEDTTSSCVFSAGSDEDEKRKSRLMRNRESAQLSRQRKKHYVDELEDKVRSMHSTITELNNKISYIMAENVSLRQQLGAGSCPPPPSAIYPPGVPPITPMHFPWIPGYAYKPQGSHAPLVPIPRLKSQQPAPAPKAKRSENKKAESKTKKVASISLLGLLLIMLAFGALFPGLNLRYGGSGDFFAGPTGVVSGGISGHSKGRVLTVSGRANGLNNTDEIGLCPGKMGFGEHCPVSTQNSSETLAALLYVPRNGKRVKINGNLIIHSVLASEKAMAEKASRDKANQLLGKDGTGLAIAGNMASALAVSQAAKEVDRHTKAYRNSAEYHRDTYGDSLNSSPADGPLQQWFREGLAGPILNSGMCTEVFQFEVSPSTDPGVIVSAASIVNATSLPPKSGRSGRMRNRRILYPQRIPLPGSTLNDTEHIGKPSDRASFHGNTSVSSMVVSVLADPREVGDGDGDGKVSPKSLSRIFVVVLLDSVKYVTYSCVLPFKSSSPHLVN